MSPCRNSCAVMSGYCQRRATIRRCGSSTCAGRARFVQQPTCGVERRQLLHPLAEIVDESPLHLVRAVALRDVTHDADD